MKVITSKAVPAVKYQNIYHLHQNANYVHQIVKTVRYIKFVKIAQMAIMSILIIFVRHALFIVLHVNFIETHPFWNVQHVNCFMRLMKTQTPKFVFKFVEICTHPIFYVIIKSMNLLMAVMTTAQLWRIFNV